MSNSLRINVLNSDYTPPEKNGFAYVWFNLFGIEEADPELVKFMAHICEDNKEAKKVIINANEKIIEQLQLFLEIHEVNLDNGSNNR